MSRLMRILRQMMTAEGHGITSERQPTGKRVLVTGAGGFIGSHVAHALARRGWQVRAMVHYNSRGRIGWLGDVESEVLKSIEILSGDIQDSAFVRQAMNGCDVVMNLAALIGIPYSYVAPAQYVATNIGGALSVLQAAKDIGVELVIQTSTSEVYGTAQTVRITEAHPLVGQSPYAATKIGADQLALSFYRSFGTPVIVVRPFNTYGPRQSTRAVIPTIITQLLASARTVTLGSLEPTRDFTFVDDTVRGFIAAAKAKEAIGEVINIGSGFEISIRDVLSTIAKVVGVEVSAQTEPARLRPTLSEVGRLLADNAKAARLLRWEPEYSGLEGFRRGIERTVSWFRSKQASLPPTRYAV
jgi:NAD dependent epimerase/dehydratase